MPEYKYKSAKPEARRARYAAKKEAINTHRREYEEARRKRETPEEEARRERVRKYQKAYHDSHREQAKERLKHPESAKKLIRNKRRVRFRKYGITPEQAETMFAEQGKCCAICKSTDSRNGRDWSTDHSHVTGKVRGILCHGCNTGLGGFRDSIQSLHAAIAYLQATSGVCT